MNCKGNWHVIGQQSCNKNSEKEHNAGIKWMLIVVHQFESHRCTLNALYKVYLMC